MDGVKLYQSKAWLARKYQLERLTAAEIAKLCGVSEMTISRYLRQFNLVPLSRRR